VTAVLFAVLHLMPWYFLEIFAIGVVLSIVTVRTNSIVPAVIIHICNNALEFAGAFVVGRELPAGPPWGIFVLAVLFAIAFAEFLRRTRDAQWQPSPLAGVAGTLEEESGSVGPAE
jgi:hypothetical protein